MEEKKLSLHDNAILSYIFNPNLTLTDVYKEDLTEELKDEEEMNATLEVVKQQELQAVLKAENKDFNDALDILEKAIETLPEKASLYNNRAQIYQFLGNYDEALVDLAKAIGLAEEKQKRTLCQALCQRGLLYRKSNKDDLARTDFNKAAELGSQFARSQLVELNPYAALCNQMLRKVMNDLK